MGISCRKLNPNWCEQDTRCPVGTLCDPYTNTCIPLDAGISPPDHLNIVQDSQPQPDAHLISDLRQLDTSLRDSLMPDRIAVNDTDTGNVTDPCANKTEGWSCYEGVAGICESSGFVEQRSCPLSQCANGHCLLPASPEECKTTNDCNGAWVCTLLVDNYGTVQQVCAAPVAGSPPPPACENGMSCAAGLCTMAGQCFQACENDPDCPDLAECKAVEIMVEGFRVNKKSCWLP